MTRARVASTGYESLRRLQDVDRRATDFVWFAAGSMFTLTFAPLGCYGLAPVLLLPFLAACLHSPPRRAARCGFWFGAGLFLFGTYWLYTSIHVFGQAPIWLAVFLMVALAAIMALWFAVIAAVVSLLACGRPVRLVAVAPAVWVAVEWFRGWFLTGFPWLSAGYGQTDSLLAGWLPVTGVYGVSFFVVFSAAAFLAGVAGAGRARRYALAAAVAPWLLGGALGLVRWTEPSGPPRTATIVQGGVSQDQKWLDGQFRQTLELYRRSIAQHAGSDLIVWPEVAIPALIEEVEPWLEALQPPIAANGQALLLGILEREARDTIYNSVLLLDGRARQVYRKRHLVPFGEYFPVPDFVREQMRLMSLPHSDMTAGADRQPLLATPDGAKLAVAICYEDAYGAEQLYALPDADILINVSNDAWFGDSIAPHQHLQIARARAREAGRFVIRATNNGISAFIGPRGELLETAPQFRYATLTRDVVPMRGATPYSVAGNLPVIGACFVLIVLFAGRRFGERRGAT